MAMRYTQEMKNFILENYKGTYSQELADKFNQRFNTDVTAKQILAYRKNNHLKSGLSGLFWKGQPAHNKGKKMSKETYQNC